MKRTGTETETGRMTNDNKRVREQIEHEQHKRQQQKDIVSSSSMTSPKSLDEAMSLRGQKAPLWWFEKTTDESMSVVLILSAYTLSYAKTLGSCSTMASIMRHQIQRNKKRMRMILARVIVGESCKGQSGYKVPLTEQGTHVHFESMVDHLQSLSISIFVISKHYQA